MGKESDFITNMNIPLGEVVWYHGKYGITGYKCEIKNTSVYLINLDGSCSDIVYLGGVNKKCKGVFGNIKSAYEYDAYTLDKKARRARKFVDDWEEKS